MSYVIFFTYVHDTREDLKELNTKDFLVCCNIGFDVVLFDQQEKQNQRGGGKGRARVLRWQRRVEPEAMGGLEREN